MSNIEDCIEITQNDHFMKSKCQNVIKRKLKYLSNQELQSKKSEIDNLQIKFTQGRNIFKRWKENS